MGMRSGVAGHVEGQLFFRDSAAYSDVLQVERVAAQGRRRKSAHLLRVEFGCIYAAFPRCEHAHSVASTKVRQQVAELNLFDERRADVGARQ